MCKKGKSASAESSDSVEEPPALATPSPKVPASCNDQDLETPPKNAAASRKRKADKDSHDPTTEPSPKAKATPKTKAKAKSKAPNKVLDAPGSSDGKKRRTRHAADDKSFARRARPKGDGDAFQQWVAIRDAFNRDIALKVDKQSAHQDTTNEIACYP